MFSTSEIIKAHLPVWPIRKTHKADTKPGRDHVIIHLNITLRPRQERYQV